MSGRYTPPKRGRGRPEPIDLRADLHGHAADYISDIDRAWFRDHPQRTSYVRAALEHELCNPHAAAEGRCEPVLTAPLGATVMIEVVKLGDGVRVRRPVYWAIGGTA